MSSHEATVDSTAELQLSIHPTDSSWYSTELCSLLHKGSPGLHCDAPPLQALRKACQERRLCDPNRRLGADFCREKKGEQI